MIDKNRLCYIVRSHYPESFGIRRFMQQVKVKRLYRFFLTESEVRTCEQNPDKIEIVIAPYLQKWEKKLKPVVEEAEDILKNAQIYRDMDKDILWIDMMFCHLAYGFIPSEYVSFGFESLTPEERREFVSDTDTNKFGYSVNNIRSLQSVLDKGDSCKRFSDYFKRDVLIIEKRGDFEKFQEFVQQHPVFVEKKVFSSMGKGTRLVDISKVGMSGKEYFDRLLMGGKHLLEERIYQRPEMARFNESSVNTIRCMTFRTDKGIEVPYCFMRTGRNGAFVDNGGSGGLVIGVDGVTGIVNTDGFDEYNNRYPKHPNTDVVFQGSQIPAWKDLIALCKKAAEEVEDIGYLSWDLAYTDQGWIVVEVNEVGQFIGPQMTMKRGIKKELTAYLDRMLKVV